MLTRENGPVLLFDGVCNLCAGSVQFIIRRDPHAKLRFASLQSEAGQQILKAYKLPEKELKSLVFIDNGQSFTRSTGALRVARYLSGLWPMLFMFIIIPRFIRDSVYDYIGKNRYKWFGQKQECWLPTPDLKKRFL
jgi:predicted DCC family thiol-disulfide oxidoreductase YuxK